MDVYMYLVEHFGVSVLDALLATIIFMVARSRYVEITEAQEYQQRKMVRLERSLLNHGIPLLPLEDE